MAVLAACAALACQDPEEPFRAAEEARVRVAFERLEPDGTGRVALDRLPAGGRRIMALSDANQDGYLDFDEFYSHHVDPGGASRLPLPEGVELRADVPYADTANPRQYLDLYLPQPRPAEPVPLVAYVHGGGWHQGSKLTGRAELGRLVATGDYAGASIGYRLSSETSWPAQMHDLKAALRWLRAHAGEYGIDPERIGVIGHSAGGHLVAMLGTAGDEPELEGDLGGHPGVRSDVQCVVDFFGPSDLRGTASTARREGGRPSSREQLLGGGADELPDIARSASPVVFASADDPPFLIVHGTEDATVAFAESERLEQALRAQGVPVLLQAVEGGGHGDFLNDETARRTALFLDACLRGLDVEVPTTVLRYPPVPTEPAVAGFLETDGERIYYEVTGEGEPIVFSHGFGGNHAIWFQQVLDFGRDHRVVTWDQRGFGRSTDRGQKASPEVFARDLLALLDHLGIARAHLVGQSMGGWTVVDFALRHPDRVRSVVLAATVGGVFSPESKRAFDLYVAGARGGGPELPEVSPESAFLYRQIASVAEPPASRIGESLLGVVRSPEELARLRLPVLLVSGERDPIFPPASIRAADALLPQSAVVEIPRAGHSGYFHQPEQWNAAVREFVATAGS